MEVTMDFLFTPVTLILVYLAIVAATLQTIFSRRKHHAGVSPSTGLTVDGSVTLLPPPGPSTLPLIGALHHLRGYGDNPYERLTALSEKYGPVYSLKMGAYPAVVVSSVEGILEVLVKKADHFVGRPALYRWEVFFAGDQNRSVLLCDYKTQKTRHRLVSEFLMFRPDSHSSNILNKVISVEIEKTLPIIKKSLDTPIDIKTTFARSTLNMFTNYMCSTNFEYDDEEFKHIASLITEIFDDTLEGHPTDFLPWLATFYKTYTNKLEYQADTIHQWMMKHIIRNRIQALESKEDIKDLSDSLLYNLKFKEVGMESVDFEMILSTLEDFFVGSASLGSVILRSMYYLAMNSEVMNYIQNEIDDKIGQSRLPNVFDLKDMPYCDAFLLEVLRKTSSVIVPHTATEDSSIQGFEVKKGTIILFNNYKINTSEQYWNKPEQFDPTRFLKEGKVKKPAHFLPFSTGKRSCWASRLVSNIVFVVVASLMQQFDVSLPTDRKFNIKLGTIAVDAQDVIFTKRK